MNPSVRACGWAGGKVRMRILDLFSGLGGFSEPFRDRGHEVVTLDNECRFNPDIVADVREIHYPSLSLDGDFDVVLASPPCQAFSVASIPHHWKGHEPDGHVTEALGLVAKTLELILSITPSYWVMENPTGMLRTLIGRPKERIYQCSFGATWKKPTDLWGRYPGEVFRPCTPHLPSPRGSKTPENVQGAPTTAERAKLPYGLGEELCKRMEDVCICECWPCGAGWHDDCVNESYDGTHGRIEERREGGNGSRQAEEIKASHASLSPLNSRSTGIQ